AQGLLQLVDLEALALASEEVLEPSAPEAADRGLPACALLTEQGGRLFEVVANEGVVTAECRHREVAPLAVGDLPAGLGVDGLDDAPVLVDVCAGHLAARAGRIGVALGARGHQREAPAQSAAGHAGDGDARGVR